MAEVKRIVVGLTGASGAALGVKALEILQQIKGVEIHLVVSHAFAAHLGCECPVSFETLRKLAHVYHDNRDCNAPIASGSFKTHGMLVNPLFNENPGGSGGRLQRQPAFTRRRRSPQGTPYAGIGSS